ncbi:MAG: hypothetical protein MUQ10_04350 [Anaerolineae bacterium]|nr:hypothetical protein [Anaerolineae bacterium]
MTIVLWLIAGTAVGTFNGLLLTKSVGGMRPEAMQQSVLVLIATGALRWIATILVITGALRTGAVAGLAAAGGLSLAYRATALVASRARDNRQQAF